MITLLAGNGRVLLNIDEHGGWEQLYYPHPGLHQQLRHTRLGLYDVEREELSWVDQEGEPEEQGYIDGSNACRTRLRAQDIDLTLDDMVHPNMDIVIRRITLHNREERPRRMRLFHYQALNLAGSLYRETAYWDPEREAVHHYKRSYHVRFVGVPAFDGHTCGEHTLKGLEASYVDAEDGDLRGNPISHGSADSVVQWNVDLAAGEKRVIHLFVLIARTRQETNALQDAIEGREPALFTSETVDYWNRWAADQRVEPSRDLSPAARELYRRSLFVLRDCSADTGSVIASPDSTTLRASGDGYDYCWWRDGAYIAQAMSDAGMRRSAEAFFAFARACQEPEGHFLHRHFPDGYLGPTWHAPSDIQVDQTASVIVALYRHYERHGDLDSLLQNWQMVRRGADFLMDFTDEAGLPRANFDLWEERKATHAYSTAMVVRALQAAANIGQALGKRSEFWSQAAERMRAAAVQAFWNPDRGCLYRSLEPQDDAVDASTLLFDLFPPGDDRYGLVVEAVEKHLWQDGVGGVARYEGDRYFGDENPWIICTLWLARAHLRLGNADRCRELIEWVVERAGPGGLLPEQVDAASGERRGVVPLVWSHSTFVHTVRAYSQSTIHAPPARVAVTTRGRHA